MTKYLWLSLALVLAWVPACRKQSSETVELNGAGATFPYPLYSKWVAEYQRQDPRVHINYQSIGSGAGIRQITDRTVDFGGSDAPMTDEQLAKAPGKLVHIPTTLGAVVVTYNLSGTVPDLKMSPEILAGIFLGQISTWNAPPIAALNPGISLPAQAITVVHRSDGSGTTAVFTDYLSKVNRAWRERVGKGTSVSWPSGLGAKGNEGVTGQVKTTPGAIGYVELAYTKQNQLPIVLLRNKAGQFVTPSTESITAAAASVATSMPDDLRVTIVDPPGGDAYPIAAFTYILVYQEMSDPARAAALAHFLWWASHDGQRFAPPLYYAPLPPQVVARVESKLSGLTSQGRPLLPRT
jgi:phosphate transport system substrate-binding protein